MQIVMHMITKIPFIFRRNLKKVALLVIACRYYDESYNEFKSRLDHNFYSTRKDVIH